MWFLFIYKKMLRRREMLTYTKKNVITEIRSPTPLRVLCKGGTVSETYEGWPTYETWAINLWITNDEGTYNELLALIREWRQHNERTIELADKLYEWVQEFPCIAEAQENATLASDLLGKSLSRVDWLDLAETYEHDF
jgi:hypothetical protein